MQGSIAIRPTLNILERNPGYDLLIETYLQCQGHKLRHRNRISLEEAYQHVYGQQACRSCQRKMASRKITTGLLTPDFP